MRENGLPRTDIKLSLEEAVNALGLSSSQYKGGDTVKLRLKLNLTNGKSYNNDGVTSSLTGSYFSSPFEYNLVIKCIPLSAVPGIYTFVMTDTPYEDGWQGSHIKVTVDGKPQITVFQVTVVVMPTLMLPLNLFQEIVKVGRLLYPFPKEQKL